MWTPLQLQIGTRITKLAIMCGLLNETDILRFGTAKHAHDTCIKGIWVHNSGAVLVGEYFLHL